MLGYDGNVPCLVRSSNQQTTCWWIWVAGLMPTHQPDANHSTMGRWIFASFRVGAAYLQLHPSTSNILNLHSILCIYNQFKNLPGPIIFFLPETILRALLSNCEQNKEKKMKIRPQDPSPFRSWHLLSDLPFAVVTLGPWSKTPKIWYSPFERTCTRCSIRLYTTCIKWIFTMFNDFRYRKLWMLCCYSCLWVHTPCNVVSLHCHLLSK